MFYSIILVYALEQQVAQQHDLLVQLQLRQRQAVHAVLVLFELLLFLGGEQTVVGRDVGALEFAQQQLALGLFVAAAFADCMTND